MKEMSDMATRTSPAEMRIVVLTLVFLSFLLAFGAKVPAGSTTTYALNAGGSTYTAVDGTVYASDVDYVSGGRTYTTTDPVSNTQDDHIYRSERYGLFSYELPVQNGKYDVTFRFAEIYFTSAGERVFDAVIEGVTVVNNLDIYAVAGHDVAHDLTLRDLPVTDGSLSVAFVPVVENPKLSAILVQPTAAPSLPTDSPTASPAPQSVSLTPVADVYFEGTSVFNTTELKIEPGTRVAYLKFDLSSISGTIETAKLKLVQATDPGQGAINVYLGSHANWTEGTITDANKPAKETLLGSLTGTYSGGNAYTFNLSGLAGGAARTLIAEMASGGNDAWFHSRTGLTPPSLELTLSQSTEPTAPAPTALLTASPTAIMSGQSSTLNWGSTNATSCTGTGFETGNAPSGTVMVSPTSTSTYSVTCTGAGGSASAHATVTVGSGGGSVVGELKQHHKITIVFDGPSTSETAVPNPFTDYRLNVTFTHRDTGISYVVPGYYAADGNAAESAAASGNKWKAHLAPDKTGTWDYVASFRTGTNVAVDLSPNAGSAVTTHINGVFGVFTVGPTDKTGRDFRGKGRLRYVGKHHLQFAGTGEFFVKGGTDSPENLLNYEDFDGTPAHSLRKSWGPHAGDWVTGDPSWRGGKGTEIIGAINYLASKGLNAFSFLTYNVGGDDNNVFPMISANAADRTRYDVSKLDQWEILFEHADKKGMFLHFKTQETENDNEPVVSLDGGSLGLERKLYYRELVARFSHHLGINWNLGEENTNTDAQRKAFASYFKNVDPYDHPVVMHTYPGDYEQYTPLLGYADFDGVSLQLDPDKAHLLTLTWLQNSRNAGRPWIVAVDEQTHASEGAVCDSDATSGTNHPLLRKTVLWGNLMAGGAGVEWYYGYHTCQTDLSLENFRSRNIFFDYTRHALAFFDNYLPFVEMANNNSLTSNTSDYVLAQPGNIYAIYLPNGGTTNLDLTGVFGTFDVRWYDPRNGGGLQTGSVSSVSGGGARALGDAPSSTSQDWAILVNKR